MQGYAGAKILVSVNVKVVDGEILPHLGASCVKYSGQVAQSVEQRTENPCVGGSIPPLATNSLK